MNPSPAEVDFDNSELMEAIDNSLNLLVEKSMMNYREGVKRGVRRREMIILKFGLDGKPPATYEALAEVYGITRERVRQIVLRGLRQMKHPNNPWRKILRRWWLG